MDHQHPLLQAWIEVGYEIFALEGPKALKVEVLARQVKKSKSSFYHHFADLEVFTKILLDYHLERSRIVGELERQCKQLVPDLLRVLVEVKLDLFFSRQLRVHRDVPQFRKCFEAVTEEVGDAMLGIWAEALGLTDNSYLAQLVLNLTLENFYLQITPETLHYDWLENYVRELQAMVHAFKENERKRSIFGGSR